MHSEVFFLCSDPSKFEPVKTTVEDVQKVNNIAEEQIIKLKKNKIE